MQKISRRQWLARAGSAFVASALLSGCRTDISGQVESVGKRLSDAYTPLGRNDCVACDNCMPCPYGIDIPTNLLFVDRAYDDGYLPGALESVDFAEKGTKFLTRFENKLPDAAQSQHCINCGECLGTCPVDINIPLQMSRITALTDILRDLRCQQL